MINPLFRPRERSFHKWQPRPDPTQILPSPLPPPSTQPSSSGSYMGQIGQQRTQLDSDKNLDQKSTMQKSDQKESGLLPSLSSIRSIQNQEYYPLLFLVPEQSLLRVPGNPKISYKMMLFDKDQDTLQAVVPTQTMRSMGRGDREKIQKYILKGETLRKQQASTQSSENINLINKNRYSSKKEKRLYIKIKQLPQISKGRNQKQSEQIVLLTSNSIFELIEAYDQFTGFPSNTQKKEEKKDDISMSLQKPNQAQSATQMRSRDYNRVNLNDFETQYQDDVVTQFEGPQLKDLKDQKNIDSNKKEEDREDFYGKKFLHHVDDNYREDKRTQKTQVGNQIHSEFMDDKSKFLTVQDLANMDPRPTPNERINVLGVVHKLGNIRMIDKTNKLRLNIEIVDPITKPFRSIVLCIWEKDNDNEECKDEFAGASNAPGLGDIVEDKPEGVIKRLQIGQCLSFKNVKVSDFGEFTLNSNIDSSVYINHESKCAPREQINKQKYAYMNIQQNLAVQVPKFFCLSVLNGRLEEQFGLKILHDKQQLQSALSDGRACYTTDTIEGKQPGSKSISNTFQNFSKDLKKSVKQHIYGKRKFENQKYYGHRPELKDKKNIVFSQISQQINYDQDELLALIEGSQDSEADENNTNTILSQNRVSSNDDQDDSLSQLKKQKSKEINYESDEDENADILEFQSQFVQDGDVHNKSIQSKSKSQKKKDEKKVSQIKQEWSELHDYIARLEQYCILKCGGTPFCRQGMRLTPLQILTRNQNWKKVLFENVIYQKMPLNSKYINPFFKQIRLISDMNNYIQRALPTYFYHKGLHQKDYPFQQRFYVFAYLQSINRQEQNTFNSENQNDQSIDNMHLMPPVFKMCPKNGCKKRLIEKRFFNKKQQGTRTDQQKYECRKCMKYYENYIPSFSFTADFGDPISCKSMQVKFFNEAGTILFGQQPDIFEKSLDFKYEHLAQLKNECNGGQTSSKAQDKEYEKQLRSHKLHQKRIFDQTINRQFLILLKSEFFSHFMPSKFDHKLQFVCENIIDMSGIEMTPETDPEKLDARLQAKQNFAQNNACFYWNQVNIFLISNLEKYQRTLCFNSNPVAMAAVKKAQQQAMSSVTQKNLADMMRETGQFQQQIQYSLATTIEQQYAEQGGDEFVTQCSNQEDARLENLIGKLGDLQGEDFRHTDSQDTYDYFSPSTIREQFENKQRTKYDDYDPRNSSNQKPNDSCIIKSNKQSIEFACFQNEDCVDDMPLYSEITQMVHNFKMDTQTVNKELNEVDEKEIADWMSTQL